MYSLIAIFTLVPLIFSHSFARLGADFIIDNGIGHFESVKMTLFLILLVSATLELITSKWAYFTKKSTLLPLGGCMLIGIFWIILFYQTQLYDLLFGIGEKRHGILLPLGLIYLSILLSSLQIHERKKLAYSIIFSGVSVALIAIIESLGYNIFTGASYTIEGSWGAVRSTSTLGNPNYVAGFLLMIPPIILSFVGRGEKYILLIIVALGIITTKSVIGIFLLSMYILFLIGERFLRKKIYTFFPVFLIGSISLMYLLFHESEKWLSLDSRFVLMKYIFLESLTSVWGFLFGHGPNTIMQFFGGERSDIINAYFPKNMIIDSSHNILIDIGSSFGYISIVLLGFWIIHHWKRLEKVGKSIVLLGFFFLSLNVLIVSHMILLVFGLSLIKKPPHM